MFFLGGGGDAKFRGARAPIDSSATGFDSSSYCAVEMTDDERVSVCEIVDEKRPAFHGTSRFLLSSWVRDAGTAHVDAG